MPRALPATVSSPGPNPIPKNNPMGICACRTRPQALNLFLKITPWASVQAKPTIQHVIVLKQANFFWKKTRLRRDRGWRGLRASDPSLASQLGSWLERLASQLGSRGKAREPTKPHPTANSETPLPPILLVQSAEGKFWGFVKEKFWS